MIVFDSNVCPTLILSAILGEMLQLDMCTHICVHNSHVYISVLKSFLSVEAYKTRYVLCLNANESSRMAVDRVFTFTCKRWLSIRVFLQGCLATSIHDKVAVHKMYQP